MKFTLNWLKDHLDTQANADTIVTKLTQLGIEVEDTQILKGFCLGCIVDVEPHPQADRLRVCYVDIGNDTIVKVVCGGSNVRKNMKVAFAPIGTLIPSSGQTLKKATIRGVESDGMLCSSEELNLGPSENHAILDLDTHAASGTDLAEIIAPVIDIVITPNRSDCFSMHGLARDLAAADMGRLVSVSTQTYAKAKPLSVSIETPLCTHFYAVHMTGIHNMESPLFMQERLKSAGLKVHNLFVDLTNYIALDLGQPMHVYDASHVKGTLHVRQGNNQSLMGLHDKEIHLTEQDIVITDDNETLALAGIMGGKASGVSEATYHIILEAAVLDPVAVARSGQHHAILSESRTRFERGVDPAMTKLAMERAVALVLEHCGGQVVATFAYATPVVQKTIAFDPSSFEKITGLAMTKDEAVCCLEKLGCHVKGEIITPPSWRHDLTITEDLVEEILRIKGYDHIPLTPLLPIAFNAPTTCAVKNIKSALKHRGLMEAYTFSFISPEQAGGTGVVLDNPISNKMVVLRASLIPSLVDVVHENVRRGQERCAIFEVASVYHGDTEERTASGMRHHFFDQRCWYEPHRKVDVYDAKADVLAAIGIAEDKMQLKPGASAHYHPGRSGTFCQGKTILAYFGELHPSYGLAHTVAFEIFLDRLPVKSISSKAQQPQISSYPFAKRDLGFVVPEAVTAEQLVKAVQDVGKTSHIKVSQTSVFDMYQDANQKVLAVQFVVQSMEKTLTDEEIKQTIDQILSNVQKKCEGVLRL